MESKTKEPTLADLQKLIQDGFKKHEARFEDLESKITSSAAAEPADNEPDVEEADDLGVETEIANPATGGLAQYYDGYNAQTGTHNLVPKLMKFVDKRIKSLEKKQEERDYVKDRKAQENEAIGWLRNLKDHTEELERNIIRELKNNPDLTKMSASGAIKQAYRNVTGLKLDKFGNPVIEKKEDTLVTESNLKPSGSDKTEDKGAGLTPESFEKMSNAEFAELEQSGKLKENWANIIGGVAA